MGKDFSASVLSLATALILGFCNAGGQAAIKSEAIRRVYARRIEGPPHPEEGPTASASGK